MRIKITFLAILLISSITIVKAKRDTVCITLRPSAATGQDIDAELNSNQSTLNEGTNVDFFSATWTCGGTCLDRALIQFDLSSIPANAIISNASLSLYVDDNASIGITGSPTYGTNNAGWLLRVTSPWAVNTVDWSTQPTTTTTDEVTIPQSSSATENYTLNVTQLYSDIMASGNNYGIMIMQQNEVSYYQSLIFGSSNNPDTSLHPKLQICYVVNDSVPVDSSNCITLRPSAATGQDIDAELNSNQSTLNEGTNVDFFSATWTCGGTCLDRALIQFDLSSIPANAIISNASLSLYVDDNASIGITGSPTYGTNNAGWLLRVTSPWAVNTVDWSTQPTTTTTDEVTIPQSSSATENYTLNVTQLYSDIMASGNNYGIMIMQQNEVSYYQSLIFGSSNNPDTSLHPKLQICYNIPTGIKAINSVSHVQVYPNPAHGTLVFKIDNILSSNTKNCFVELYNSIGEKVRTFKLYSYMTSISTDGLASGLYMYRIMDNSYCIQSGKEVLQ